MVKVWWCNLTQNILEIKYRKKKFDRYSTRSNFYIPKEIEYY